MRLMGIPFIRKAHTSPIPCSGNSRRNTVCGRSLYDNILVMPSLFPLVALIRFVIYSAAEHKGMEGRFLDCSTGQQPD